MPDTALPSHRALAALWHAVKLPAAALDHVDLPGTTPVLPSSFDIATAAQARLGVAGLAAVEVWHLRRGGGDRPRQAMRVARDHAVLECRGAFTLDGRAPDVWDKLSGLYPCGADVGAPGFVRLHANFAHHRDRSLQVLGCPAGADTGRDAVAAALRGWRAEAFEDAVAAAGGAAAAVRSFDAWDRHPQAAAVAARPVVRLEQLADDAGPPAPRHWPALADGDRPLRGLRVLDLTRILAGPVAGRTLAGYGADVMLVNSPSLPNIASIAETSRGKRSAHVDLETDAGRATMHGLVAGAHVFLHGYRPGALAARGFAPADLAHLAPGIVIVSLSAYGDDGPWAGRRGFDSLVQSATGFNVAEAEAAGAAEPKALPLQILDYAAGHLLAFGAAAALWRQQQEGGSWQVDVSLAGVGRWLRGLGRVADGFDVAPADPRPFERREATGFGELVAVRHAVELAATPVGFERAAMPPGTHPPEWR